MTGKTKIAMWRAGIAVLCLFHSCHAAAQETSSAKKTTLDPGTVQMLSNILESLDSFRDDRLRDLEKIRLSTPAGNGTSVTPRVGEVVPKKNSSVSEHIKALKEGIMGHNPVKKTFGYKVTVYTSPIGEDGKDSKPVLVTQYVGGDMMPDPPLRRADEAEDLEESGNHPEKQVVQSSESVLLPVQSSSGEKSDHRNTAHSESSEKGHSNGHRLSTKLAKGHDHEKHSDKHDEHHKETEKESHRHDTQAHDKGGATQQGIRERTEIEYYEREHFLDTEYDKAKSGHDKTKGLKEHESHNDHDSHEDKKVHAKDDSHKEKSHAGGSLGKDHATQEGVLLDTISGGHYTPPLTPSQYHKQGHKDSVHEDNLSLKEDEGSSRLHHSEESKGHREHSSEKDHQSEEKDQGYLDKDKGRRKEGYRERGYKITAEREYFLNDAHHDKGHASHTSGSKLKEEEGAASGAKEGERDLGFIKEEKQEEVHDAAFDAMEHKFVDGEAHALAKEEVVPLAPPVVNYVEEHPIPHHSAYPLPIVYAPSTNDGAQLAYPPADLNPKSPKTPNALHKPKEHQKALPPLGGYDDDLDEKTGYIGHASYKKRNNPTPLVANIRDGVRKDVLAPPPSYAKTEDTTEPPSSENSVQFPDGSGEHQYKTNPENNHYTRQEEKQLYTPPPKYNNQKDSEKVHVPKPYRQYNERDLYSERQRPEEPPSNHRQYSEELNRKRPEEPSHADIHRQYSEELNRKRPDVDNHRQYSEELNRKRPEEPPQLGHQDPRSLYLQGAQNADKLVRSAYPQLQSGTVPTVGQLIQEIVRYPQTQDAQRYTLPPPPPQRNNANDNNKLSYADLHRIYSQERQARGHQQGGYRGHPGRYNHALHNQQSGEVSLEQALKLQQQQVPRTALEQIQQQQTKPPFSPVVLLSRGPPAQRQNQAVDVWYTRQRS